MADAAPRETGVQLVPEEHWLSRTADRDPARIIFTEAQIQRRVEEMADEITRFYPEDEDLLVLGLLKGSFIFLADLVRAIDRPLHVDFIVASSYGSGTTSSGNVRLLYDPMAPIAGRHVLLVEDIVDSGNTINRLREALDQREPESLELCALLHKHLAENLALEPRWTGFDAPPEFLVGYGLDHAEDYRHLPFVAGL
ncbi:MAG: hypoxanthine phosphoribosyltransferase [Gemmatimonadales bacterium]|jgi:hypoxanthine phosphoribosyltransferase